MTEKSSCPVLRGRDDGNIILLLDDLSEADLRRADLTGTNLSDADLRRANLVAALFRRTVLRATDLSLAIIGETVFGDVNLQAAHGLEQMMHQGPSTLGVDTLYRSHGEIPESFLQGVGVPAAFLATCASIRKQPAQYATCLISYASEDQAFVDQLCADLHARGIRCWLCLKEHVQTSPKDEGEEWPCRADLLLLVLSSYALHGGWVSQEVHRALVTASQQGKPVLFPIQLDEALAQSPEAWGADLRQLRRISDFRGWTLHERYQEKLEQLCREFTQWAR